MKGRGSRETLSTISSSLIEAAQSWALPSSSWTRGDQCSGRALPGHPGEHGHQDQQGVHRGGCNHSRLYYGEKDHSSTFNWMTFNFSETHNRDDHPGRLVSEGVGSWRPLRHSWPSSSSCWQIVTSLIAIRINITTYKIWFIYSFILSWSGGGALSMIFFKNRQLTPPKVHQKGGHYVSGKVSRTSIYFESWRN